MDGSVGVGLGLGTGKLGLEREGVEEFLCFPVPSSALLIHNFYYRLPYNCAKRGLLNEKSPCKMWLSSEFLASVEEEARNTRAEPLETTTAQPHRHYYEKEIIIIVSGSKTKTDCSRFPPKSVKKEAGARGSLSLETGSVYFE